MGAVPKGVAWVGGPGRLRPDGEGELRREVRFEDLLRRSKEIDEDIWTYGN